MDEQASIRDEPVLISPPTKTPREGSGGGGGGAQRWGGIGVSCPRHGPSPSPAAGPRITGPLLVRFPLKKDREPVSLLCSSAGYRTPLFCDEDDGVLTLAPASLKSRLWSQKDRLNKKASQWKKTNKYKNLYVHRSSSTSTRTPEGTVLTSCGVPQRLQPNNTRSISTWCFTYTLKKRRRKEKRKDNNKAKKRKINKNKHAPRAQAES